MRRARTSVVTFDVSGPGRDTGRDLLRDPIERLFGVAQEKVGHSLVSEFLAVPVGRFRDSVRESDQQIPRLEPERLLFERGAGKHSDREAFPWEAENLTTSDQHWSEMAGVRVNQLSVVVGIEAQEECRILFGRAARIQMIIHDRNNAGR
jgi:hypothetical protein